MGYYCKDCANGEPYKNGIYCSHYKQVYREYDDCGGRYFRSKYGSTTGGPCIFSTACIKAMGKNDDCYELTVLRNFRDTYVISQINGKSDTEYYYEIAPKIVENIEKRENNIEILQTIYRNLVLPMVKLICGGELQLAYTYYKDYFFTLMKEFYQ